MNQRKWESCRRNVKKHSSIRSRCGHEKSALKEGGPSSKPKYYLMTDSEAVPWGKGEKNPGRGVKRIWNLVFTSRQRALRLDVVLFVERSGELIYVARLRYSVPEPKGNRVWKARWVILIRPETEWPIHVQAEAGVKSRGGPNRPPLKRRRMTCG